MGTFELGMHAEFKESYMADVISRTGQRVVIGSTYQARGFLLGAAEELTADPRDFDLTTHPPKLIQLQKGESYVALSGERDGQLYVKVERDGQHFACCLLAGSFDVSA